MVDRCERWEVQDGERKDLRSKCHFCGQGQGLGRRYKREIRWHLGVYDQPTKKYVAITGSRENWAKFPLEFRLHGDSDVGSRIDSLLLTGPEKIELACDRDACARNDPKRFETGISHLRTSAVLAVLNNRVV
jgi:hypothetical protein